jgi:hypothetical protein
MLAACSRLKGRYLDTILENTPSLSRRGGISADVNWGKKMKRVKR